MTVRCLAIRLMTHSDAIYESIGTDKVKQLTVRGFEEELAETIRRVAERDNTSLNKAALKLLRKGAGLSEDTGRTDTVGSSLDHLIGSWSHNEAAEFDAALEDFETIDESIWR